ncbi:hypothetical protein [Buttiauxella sp. JUb87]|uniref:hypothetical protein n=1 Tax=Buttiauxella sp. JUb87 TaxID=2485129 RepID=UPI001FB6868A|nr:hypothetical protein [Buttiauxella sp. JUb87]
MTKEMETLQAVGNAPELNTLTALAAKMTWMQLFGSDESQRKILAEMGGKLRKDGMGNDIVDLPSGSYALNKPGLSPQDVASVIAELLAFAPVARIAGAGIMGVAKIAALTGVTELGLESATQAMGGEDISASDVALFTVLGALPPGVINSAKWLVSSIRGKAGTSAKDAATALKKAVDAETSRILSSLSPEASAAEQAAALREIGDLNVALSEINARLSPEALREILSPAAQQTSMIAATKEGLRGDFSKLAQEAMPIEARIKAAEALGLNPDLIPASFFSGNTQFIEFYQALKQMPASILSPVEGEAVEQIARRADKLIADAGGVEDLSALDFSVKSSINKAITDLTTESDSLYKRIASSVPANMQVEAKGVLQLVTDEIARLGGRADLLDPVEKDVLRYLSPQIIDGKKVNPTYHALDKLRKDVEKTKRGINDPYANTDRGKLKLIGSALRGDQMTSLDNTNGLDSVFDLAQQLVAKRKQLEYQSKELFGRDIGKSLIPSLKGAVTAATKGDATKIKEIMDNIPSEMRGEVASSALHFLFTGGGRKAGQAVSLNGFVNSYEGLMRNKLARNELFKYLTPETRNYLDKYYQVAKGAANAINSVPKTGIVSTLSSQFKEADTLAERILVGDVPAPVKFAAKVLEYTPMVAIPARIAKGTGKAALEQITGGAMDTRMKRGIEMMAGPEFQQHAKDYANRRIVSQALIRKSETALALSDKYTKWLSTLEPMEQALIKRSGPIRTFAFWAITPERSDSDEEPRITITKGYNK